MTYLLNNFLIHIYMYKKIKNPITGRMVQIN